MSYSFAKGVTPLDVALLLNVEPSQVTIEDHGDQIIVKVKDYKLTSTDEANLQKLIGLKPITRQEVTR